MRAKERFLLRSKPIQNPSNHEKISFLFVVDTLFNNIFTKSYAGNDTHELALPSENKMEITATGTSRSADYEIVTIYGRKYIIFSNGDDIEVLNY